MRSMCAGVQRYATYWTGDILCNYEWMKKSIRAMQTAGLGGFPYFNHDAGGFRDPGPDDNMYIQWAMAFGSFSPIWRPHGSGKNKRWPLDRSIACQKEAAKYSTLRYQLMPFIYTSAYNAHETGMPMAKAMVIDYQYNPLAWKFDLQYIWCEQMLIAPNCSASDTLMNIWLPPGQNWYYYWNDSKIPGDRVIKHKATFGELPIFIKEGAIIPSYNFALNTFSLDASLLNLDIYTGKDGDYTLYEDDGVTERFRTRNEYRTTQIIFISLEKTITIKAAKGNYFNAPIVRTYKVKLHSVTKPTQCLINGTPINIFNSKDISGPEKKGAFFDIAKKTVTIFTGQYDCTKDVVIKIK
jgi:alpha-glucosidase (family GH31 glycosyl hydrolase)